VYNSLLVLAYLGKLHGFSIRFVFANLVAETRNQIIHKHVICHCVMENRIEKLASHLNEFIGFVHSNIILKILKSQNYTSEPFRFYYSILFKTNNGLYTINHLIGGSKNNPQYFDSIFVLLRALLADSITFRHVLHESLENNELEKTIKSLYYDHIDKTIENLRGPYKRIKNLSDNEIKSHIEGLKKNRKEYFDNDGEPLYKPLKSSPSKAIKYIISNPAARNKPPLLGESFELYDTFSKYEHFGDLSFTLIHQQFKNETNEELYNKIFLSVHILVTTIKTTIKVWPSLFQDIQQEIDTQFDDIFNALENWKKD